MTRGAAALVGAAALALAGLAIALVATSDHVGRPAASGALYSAVSLAFVAAGLIAARRRPGNRTGKLMIAVGFLFFAGALTAANDAFLFTVGSASSALAYALVVALALSYPEGVLRDRVDRGIVAATVVLASAGQILFLLVADPEKLCAEGQVCPENLLDATDDPTLTRAVEWTLNLAVAVIGAAFVLRLVQRWRGASPALRRALTPVYATTGFAVAVIVGLLLVSSALGRITALGWVLQIVSLLLIPVAFLVGLLRSRLAQTSIGELLVAIGRGDPLRRALADALGDPDLELGFWLEGRQAFVDETGRRIEPESPGPARAATYVTKQGRPVAAIVHDAGLVEERELVEGVVEAARLALQTEALQAEAQAQYAFLVTLVNTAPSLFLHIDTNGVIRNQNAAAVQVAGYDDEEHVRGRLFWDVFIDPWERDEVIARFEAGRPDFTAGEYENAFLNARGERRVVFWRSAPVHDDSGQVAGIISGGIDLTARAEEAEHRDREREFLNAIANEAPSLLCLVDYDGVLEPLASNRTFEQALGYANHETGGHVFWTRYVAPEDAADVERRIRAVAAGERMEPTDSTWLTRDGRRLTISWSATRLPPLDELRLLLVSGVDVTERRQRELDVLRERDATTTVLQAIPGVIAVLDRDGRVRDRDVDNPLAAVNRSFRDTFGWSDPELVGRAFVDIVVEEDREDARAAIAEAAAGDTSEEVESRWSTRDGRLLDVSWTASPVLDVTGRTEGLVLVSGVDVTDRKRRALEDQRRRAFIDAITGTIPSYLLLVEPDGSIRSDGVNEAFEQAFGWKAEELAGRSFVGCVTPEGDVGAHRLIDGAAAGERQGEIESRWDAQGGDSRIVAWTARPITGVGGERVVLVTGNDVTERRLQEEELRASRQRIVAAADEARRRLERNLHDGAQQRLVALSVSLRLAESKLATDPDTARRIITGAREELGLALEELRELARGIHPAVLTDRGLGPALEALAGRVSVPVALSLPPEPLPPAVEAAIYYVVAEALTNVVRYARADSVTVDVLALDRLAIASVRDDGIGGADPSAGTGLRGLADRVAALDGRLEVDSPPGEGTCVRVEIPIHSTATPRPRAGLVDSTP